VRRAGQELFNENLSTLRALWSDVTRRIQSLRDNPACAESEFQLKLDRTDPGITPKLTFDLGVMATEGPRDSTAESAFSHSVASAPSVATFRPPIAIPGADGNSRIYPWFACIRLVDPNNVQHLLSQSISRQHRLSHQERTISSRQSFCHSTALLSASVRTRPDNL